MKKNKNPWDKNGVEITNAHKRAVFEVPCPACLAPAGEPCTWPKAGESSHSHKERHDLWKAAPTVPQAKVTLKPLPWK